MKASPKLTNREEQIMNELAQGMLNKEIAGNLNISVETVKKHLKSIFKKLGVRNRVESIVVNQRRKNNSFM